MSDLKAIEVDCRFLDALSDAVVILDENLSILYVSSNAERILGISKNELLLKNCRDIFGKSFSQNIRSGAIVSYRNGNIKRRIKINYISKIDNFFIAILSPGPTYEQEDLFLGMVGVSKSMKQIFELIKVVANSSSPVLITGETGTGKEMVAEAIHNLSGRTGQIVKVNCSAFPETLLESELFGYVRGAFTGADRNKPGKFEMANNGTLFLDEIGDLPINLQPKILRAVERGEIEKLGDNKTTYVNTRVICATNKNIEKEVQEGKFRSDLYFRISVFRIHLPPLRERKEDIIPLSEYILEKLSQKYGLGQKYLTKTAIELILSWDFPGNIRELENLLERAYVMSKGETINEDVIAEHKFLLSKTYERNTGNSISEKDRILEAIRKTNSVKEAAEILGISRITLWRKMKKYGIDFRRLAKSSMY
ncbi:MAG: sigma 54-interacting transcriptional regulator [Candidatus Calescibacterium sp.]|nr:sigma 54-interacting transcriptional regulator [Candidatus Calescibacterium sp.]MCX7734665.1 sigma 54-interacting transcriptional regulator [bacterium]MDW8087789.1 sigma 54-interacting transcriptional regulator [Candidatus Calescibacterium sp.]